MTRSPARRVLLSRDTLLWLLIVLILAGVCVMLGRWQFGRYEDRRTHADLVASHYDAAPVDRESILPTPNASLPPDAEWTPITLRGSYCTDPECILYVRNRTLSGDVGYWQLAPFTAEDGTALLVVRGWVPQDGDGQVPAQPAAVPEDTLTITVRLRPPEPVLDRERPEGQVHSVSPQQIETILPPLDAAMITGAYGELDAEDPAGERPIPLPRPDTGLGPHLSYAVQWWVFALFFPAAWIYRTRRQIQDLRTETNPDPTPRRVDHRPRSAARSRRRGHDEEEEDALIDQHTL